MSGLAGGATVVLAPVKWPARFYIFCILIPGSLLIRLTMIGPVISLLGFAFFVVMMLSHGSARQLLIDAIRKRSENQDLLQDVQRQRSEIEAVNTELRAAEMALRQQNANLETEVASRTERIRLAYSVIRNTAEGVLVSDPDGTIVEVNPAFTGITGYPASEAVGQSIKLLHSFRQDERHYDHLMQRLADVGKWEGEMWSRRNDGSVFLERRRIDAVRDSNGVATHFVSVFHDITEIYYKDEQMRFMASHDPLTGLANRSLLQEHVQTAIAHAYRDKRHVGILFLDLDQFKGINDTLGHHIGDALLVEVGTRLKSCLRETDTLARQGGDEFVVLANSIAHAEDCMRLADKLRNALEAPFVIVGANIHVNTSIGVAIYPEDGDTFEILLKNADMALYAAKGAGKNRHELFHTAMSAQAAARRELEVALREAIAQDQLTVHFQAKVDAHSSHATGFEALVRWERPGHGFIPPEKFIPVAEESGLIDAVGRAVMDKACQQIALWHEAGLGWQKVAVNVSARQLLHQDILGLIRDNMQRHGVPQGCLEIEVTESVVMAKPEKTIPLLREIRAQGICIAIDDFGTGHSSLAYLRTLPINVMKIDRAFVHEAAHDPTAQAIITAIVSLSRALNLLVVAEGVETPEQADMLRDAGCHQLQGYHFANPMAANEIAERWLRKPPA
jgi:diguanylate cyclase (GGDEF)-like protein/PAS domain S-box-containing protein